MFLNLPNLTPIFTFCYCAESHCKLPVTS